MREHNCACGSKWLVERHTTARTEIGRLDCRCGKPIILWSAEEQYTAHQIWNNPIFIREALQTSKPNENFPSGTEIHVSTYTNNGLRLIYVGDRGYFVEEMPLVRAIEGR